MHLLASQGRPSQLKQNSAQRGRTAPKRKTRTVTGTSFANSNGRRGRLLSKRQISQIVSAC